MKAVFSLLLLFASGLVAFGQSADDKKITAEADIPRITIAEAKKAFDDGAIFVDSRNADAFEQERIKGAIRIDGAAEDRFDKLPKGKKIIVYCS